MAGSATADIEHDLKAARRGRLGRRAGVTVLTLLIAAGLSGNLGVRSATVTATEDGYRVTVIYPRVTRGGLAASWSVEVTRTGGFGRPVTIAVTQRYLDLFDHNSLDPAPTSERVRGELLEWTFEPPAGETLTVSLDARVEPARQSGGSATTAVVVGDAFVAEVAYRTTILP